MSAALDHISTPQDRDDFVTNGERYDARYITSIARDIHRDDEVGDGYSRLSIIDRKLDLRPRDDTPVECALHVSESAPGHTRRVGRH